MGALRLWSADIGGVVGETEPKEGPRAAGLSRGRTWPMLKAQRSSLKQVSRDRKSISWLPRVWAVGARRGVIVSRFGVSFGGC